MLSQRISHQTRHGATTAIGGSDAAKGDSSSPDTPFAAALDAAGIAPNAGTATLAGGASGDLADGASARHGRRDKHVSLGLTAASQLPLAVLPLPDGSANAPPSSHGDAAPSARGVSASSDAPSRETTALSSAVWGVSVQSPPGQVAMATTSQSGDVLPLAETGSAEVGGSLNATSSAKESPSSAGAAGANQTVGGDVTSSNLRTSLMGLLDTAASDIVPSRVGAASRAGLNAVAPGAAASAAQRAAAALGAAATGLATAGTDSREPTTAIAAGAGGTANKAAVLTGVAAPGAGPLAAPGQDIDPSSLIGTAPSDGTAVGTVATGRAAHAGSGDSSTVLAGPGQTPAPPGSATLDVAVIAAATTPDQQTDRSHSAWGPRASDAAGAAAVVAPGGGADNAPSAATGGPTSASPVVTAGSADVPNQVATQLVRLVSTDSRGMVMRLHPPELGDLTVRVAVAGHGVSAWFSSPQPQVRDAISAGIGQLQASLAGAGYNLNGAWVGGDASSAHQQGANQPLPRLLRDAAAPSAIEAPATAASAQPTATGLNVYA